MQVKLCRDCVWSVADSVFLEQLRCTNTSVTSKDAEALAAKSLHFGTSARKERANTSIFAVCGRRGKLWCNASNYRLD